MTEELDKIKDELEGLKFFSDQVRVNATLYKGMEMILGHIIKIEEKLGILDGVENEKSSE